MHTLTTSDFFEKAKVPPQAPQQRSEPENEERREQINHPFGDDIFRFEVFEDLHEGKTGAIRKINPELPAPVCLVISFPRYRQNIS